MQTTKRQHDAVLIEPLLAAPYRYQFAQLLNILVRMLRQQEGCRRRQGRITSRSAPIRARSPPGPPK